MATRGVIIMQVDEVYLQYLDSGLVYSFRIVGVYHGMIHTESNIGYIEVDVLGNNKADEQLRIPMRLFEAMIIGGILRKIK